MARGSLLALTAVLGLAACAPVSSSTPSPGGPSGQPGSGQPATSTPATATPAGLITRAGQMTMTRAGHTATLLPDGRVLVTGGCTQRSCEGVTAATELIDPASGTSVRGPDMLQRRVGHTAVTLSDGRILLIGGFGQQGVLATTELFDPATGSFAAGPELSAPRADVAAFLLPDLSVLVAGGFDGQVSVATTEILDATATAFRETAAMSVTRSSHAGALLSDGRVLITGGGSGGGSGEVRASAEVYDPAAGTWAATGEMTARRHKHAAAVLPDGRVLVIGGSDERDSRGRYRSAEIYDPVAGTFGSAGDMGAARYKIVSAVVRLQDGRLLVAGGAPGAEVFDPVGARFEPVGGDGTVDQSFAAAVLLDDGSVYVTGGYDPSIELTDQVLRYTP